MKFILTLVIFFSISHAYATSDYSSLSVIRTYPVGFFTSGTFGEAKKIWGQENEKIKYGFLRASTTLQSSVVVNSAMAQIDFYPISFLGFYAGKDYTYRDFDIFTFDCEKIQCRGSLDRNFVGTRMVLGYKNVFVMGEFRSISETVKNSDKPFADERATLIGGPKHDTLHRYDFVAGYKLNESYTTGFLIHRNSMQKYQNTSHMNQGFLRYQAPTWSLMGSAGTFRSRNDQLFYSTLLMFQWTGAKGLLLF
jgi:hypothetical protein